tara:strand:- start:681 stop:2504 length:1824 start_codon:yes stop_codon:yes gene_type:complete
MKSFLRILSFSKPYRLITIFAFLASILYGIFNAISLWIVGSLIGTIMSSENSISTSTISESNNLINQIGVYFEQLLEGSNQIEKLKLVCICLFITFIFKNIFYYINWVSISILELKIIKDLRNHLYEKIHSFSLSFFSKNRSGELLSIMLNDINLITVAFNLTFQVFFHEFISMLILFSMLFLISPKLTLIVFFTIPLSGYIIVKIGQSIRRKATRASYKIADLSSAISEKIRGISVVKAFNMTKNEIINFININENFYLLQLNQKRLLGLTTPINDIIGVSLASLLLWFGGQQVLISSSLSSDDFLRFIIFLFALLQPARKMGNAIAQVQSGIAGANRVFNILDLESNKKNDLNLKNIHTFNHSIVFDSIDFKYNNNKNFALNNINVKINKGQKIALVGKSGSGKTTFVNLIMDFYKPDSGELFIDDYNYKLTSTKSIRNLIGFVSQNPILFNDSIKNNISYGLKEYDLNDIVNAAKTANINDFIDKLPKKYDEIISEGGTNLSGGQKQRISIARSILRDPPILILDEATSALDSDSEFKVQQAIDNLIDDRTVIVIAHRLSTIKNADKIIVFDNGKIVGEGSHIDLYNNNNIYTNLYNLQFAINE